MLLTLELELDDNEKVISSATVKASIKVIEICKQESTSSSSVIAGDGEDADSGIGIENSPVTHISSDTTVLPHVTRVQTAQPLRSKPVALQDLEAYIARLDQADGFKTEFDSLPAPTTQLRHWSYASLPQNQVKHRYPPPEDNLLTYDDTRVVLTKLPGDQYSDFINANWIDDYNNQRHYIATQCPIESTIDDFYRMVWQYNVHQVVMLASPHDVERGKCAKYFPEDSAVYGGVNVDLQRKDEFPDVVVRIYSLKKNGVARVFVHHHFVSWPDLGVPEDPQQLLNLILRYRSSDSFTRAWPLVIHCSAGVGRTGTFILTDAQFDKAKELKRVDFLEYLWHIRTQRISVVEKPEQYRLAHRVILKAYQQGLFEESNKTVAAIMNEKLISAMGSSPSEIKSGGDDDENELDKAKRKTKIFIDPESTDHEIVIRVANTPRVMCAA